MFDVEIEGDPVAAAREALRIQRKPTSVATVFAVKNTATGEVTTVDLNPEAN